MILVPAKDVTELFVKLWRGSVEVMELSYQGIVRDHGDIKLGWRLALERILFLDNGVRVSQMPCLVLEARGRKRLITSAVIERHAAESSALKESSGDAHDTAWPK